MDVFPLHEFLYFMRARVGVLVQQGLIDIDLVDELLGRQIYGVWQASARYGNARPRKKTPVSPLQVADRYLRLVKSH